MSLKNKTAELRKKSKKLYIELLEEEERLIKLKEELKLPDTIEDWLTLYACTPSSRYFLIYKKLDALASEIMRLEYAQFIPKIKRFRV